MSNLKRFSLASLFALTFVVAGGAFADQTINTGIPGGDGKDLLNDPKNPADRPAGALLVHDQECAKKTKSGKLVAGQPNPAYEKCVHDKLEKAKKSGNSK
ncbi:MAG: hypothetical protein JST04_03530 [Bdellovibrionales bacterium]|nr:hypothetical protein [Bdellovibrionales bacterium]